MPQQSVIQLPNGAATPVIKDFLPRGSSSTPTGKHYSLWRDQSAANAAGFVTLEELYGKPSGANGSESYQWTVKIPRLTTVGTNDAGIVPAPSLDFLALARIGFQVPVRADSAMLADLTQYVASLAADYITLVVRNRNPTY